MGGAEGEEREKQECKSGQRKRKAEQRESGNGENTSFGEGCKSIFAGIFTLMRRKRRAPPGGPEYLVAGMTFK
jgi:hypothetical protein